MRINFPLGFSKVQKINNGSRESDVRRVTSVWVDVKNISGKNDSFQCVESNSSIYVNCKSRFFSPRGKNATQE